MQTTDTTFAPTLTGSSPRHPVPVGRGVVVGFDGSPSAVTAVRWASGEAARRGTRLTVLTAVDLFGPTSGMFPPVTDLAEDSQDAAVQLADEGASLGRTVGGSVDVATESLVARPVTALVDASGWADLLVLGNRGRGAVASALLGSVAFTVTADARCPVVVVRGDADRVVGEQWPVVVGVDGSPDARDAVRFAADTALRGGAELQLLGAWLLSPFLGTELAYGVQVEADDVSGVRRAAEGAVQRAAEAVRSTHPGLRVTGDVVEETPGKALVRTSHRAGMVVVGARGHGRVGGLLLGSVSHATIHGAQCPVAVVRPTTPRN